MLILDEYTRKRLIGALKLRKLPFSVVIKSGKPRSVDQNKLQRKWLLEAAEQLEGNTPEELRGYCKLHFGVPIVRNENDKFREAYDKYLRPLSYEHKIALMQTPLDFPVTRIMTTKQKTLYLDNMYTHFTGLGCILTVPKKG